MSPELEELTALDPPLFIAPDEELFDVEAELVLPAAAEAKAANPDLLGSSFTLDEVDLPVSAIREKTFRTKQQHSAHVLEETVFPGWRGGGGEGCVFFNNDQDDDTCVTPFGRPSRPKNGVECAISVCTTWKQIRL